MARSDVERLVEAIAIDLDTESPKPHECKDMRALLRAAERMRVKCGEGEWGEREAHAWDRAKARILGEKPRG